MNLLVDIGNSSVKAVYASKGNFSPVYSCVNDNYFEFIHDLINDKKPNRIFISSVRGFDVGEKVKLKETCDELIVVDSKINLPIKINYSTPNTLGPDRICSAVGASYFFPKMDVIIFDFGTALTIDRLSASGEFCGGNISPGMMTRIRALHDYTHMIPMIDIPDKITEMGKSTKEAVESGIILGILFELEGYMNRNPDSVYIFSGGDAIYFAKRMKRSIFVVYNLVIMGLARIADYHAKF